MSDSELVAQRRANYEELLALGIRPYPNAYDATHRIGDIVATYGEHAGEALEAEHVPVRAAGRILGLRTFGKANFLVLSDGAATLQVYIRQDSVSAEAFAMFKLLDFGDQVGVDGRLFRTRTNELTIWASALDVPRQELPAAAGEVARPAGHRDALPAALPRPDRQPRCAPRLRRAGPHARRPSAASSTRAASSRSRRR